MGSSAAMSYNDYDDELGGETCSLQEFPLQAWGGGDDVNPASASTIQSLARWDKFLEEIRTFRYIFFFHPSKCS